MGNKKMPTEVEFIQDTEENQGSGEENEENGNKDDKNEEEKLEQEESKTSEPEMSQFEWDCRIVEAFKRTLIECIKDTELPMEPSDFQKFFTEYSLEDYTAIDLRKSSFKKIGKLLDQMSTLKNGLGLIVYTENKVKGHKLIT